MSFDHSTKASHAKIVLDYSFCNSSNLWNYLGVITIALFLGTLLSYLKHRQHEKTVRHQKNNPTWIYVVILILLALFFVVPCMCWLLTFVEILVTFVRYGHIAASPLPILSLPIRLLAFVFTKLVSSIHWYLTAPGTFIFLLFFVALKCIKLIFLITVRFGLWGVFFCAWIGLAMPLYAVVEVGSADSWIDLAFNSQLPLLIILKCLPLMISVRRPFLCVFLFLCFLLGYFLKFGLTSVFVCKCLLIVTLVRFTYVIGKAFVVLVFFTPITTNPSRDEDHVQ